MLPPGTKTMVYWNESRDIYKVIFSFWWHQTYRKQGYSSADLSCLSMENNIGATQCVQAGGYLEPGSFSDIS